MGPGLDRLTLVLHAIEEAAARHDRDGSFPFDSIERLYLAGILSLTVPTALGGGCGGLALAAQAINKVGTSAGHLRGALLPMMVASRRCTLSPHGASMRRDMSAAFARSSSPSPAYPIRRSCSPTPITTSACDMRPRSSTGAAMIVTPAM